MTILSKSPALPMPMDLASLINNGSTDLTPKVAFRRMGQMATQKIMDTLENSPIPNSKRKTENRANGLNWPKKDKRGLKTLSKF
jgi:hypothetical protein